MLPEPKQADRRHQHGGRTIIAPALTSRRRAADHRESTDRTGDAAPGRQLRVMRIVRQRRGSSHSSSEGPATQRARCPARLGPTDGGTTAQNTRRVRIVSPRNSRGPGRRSPTHAALTRESRMPANGHVQFGGGPGEKGWLASTSPAAYPTKTRARTGRRCSRPALRLGCAESDGKHFV